MALPSRSSRALGRLLTSPGSRLHNTHAHSATPGMMEVCAIDPLLVLEPERLRHATAADGTEPFATVSVPFRLLAQLHQGHLELAEHDDPGNHWYFGRRGEFPFQYRFAGRHRVESGFTSLVLAHELHALQHAPPERANRKQAAGEERSWLAFLQHVRGSSGEGLWPTPALPFLFAGKVIDCASAGLYTLEGEGGGAAGLVLSSEYDTPGQ